MDDPVEEPVDDPGVVEFSPELLEEPVVPEVLFDLFLSLSFEELLGEVEFMLPFGEEVLGLVVSEGVLDPGVEDVPGDEELGADVVGDDVLDPGVPGEVV